MGNPRTPDTIREYTGIKSTVGKRKVTGGGSLPEPPNELGAGAVREWWRVVPLLERWRLVNELDFAVIAAYCSALATFLEAEADVSARGIVVTSAREDGALVKNPSVAIRRDAANQVRQLAGELGMTPASRAGFDVPSLGTADGDTTIVDEFGDFA